MRKYPKPSSLSRMLILIGSSSILPVGSCTSEQVNAVVNGLLVVSQSLDTKDEVTLGDWLASELDN